SISCQSPQTPWQSGRLAQPNRHKCLVHQGVVAPPATLPSSLKVGRVAGAAADWLPKVRLSASSTPGDRVATGKPTRPRFRHALRPPEVRPHCNAAPPPGDNKDRRDATTDDRLALHPGGTRRGGLADDLPPAEPPRRRPGLLPGNHPGSLAVGRAPACHGLGCAPDHRRHPAGGESLALTPPGPFSSCGP